MREISLIRAETFEERKKKVGRAEKDPKTRVCNLESRL